MDPKMQGKQTYVDFEPVYKWNKEEESDILELHVQEFRKSELKVQVNSLGTLLVTGKRQLEDKRWSRFRQEFKLTKEHCPNSIRAKLGNGVLHITVPRKDVNHTRPSFQEENYWTAGDETGSERLWLQGSYWRLGFVDRKKVLKVSIAVLAAAAIGVGTYFVSKHWLKNGDHTNQSIPDYSTSQLMALPPS